MDKTTLDEIRERVKTEGQPVMGRYSSIVNSLLQARYDRALLLIELEELTELRIDWLAQRIHYEAQLKAMEQDK